MSNCNHCHRRIENLKDYNMCNGLTAMGRITLKRCIYFLPLRSMRIWDEQRIPPQAPRGGTGNSNRKHCPKGYLDIWNENKQR